MCTINEHGQLVITLLDGRDYVTLIDGSCFDDEMLMPLDECVAVCEALELLVKESGVEIKLKNIPFGQREYYKQWFLALIEQYQKEHKEIENPTYEHVEHPNHYNTYPMETINMMVAIWGKEKVADWCEITAFKYRMRMGTKPDNSIEQDLEKEQWYIAKAKGLRQ